MQLTRDQNLATMLVDMGQLAPEDVASFSYKNIILQALGSEGPLDVALQRIPLQPGDVLLVCSDGLHGPLGDDAIRAVLERETSSRAASEALIALANAAGGPDNVTCIVARIDGLPEDPALEHVRATEPDLEVIWPKGDKPAESGGALVGWLRGLFKR
jgi:protein phosphatase